MISNLNVVSLSWLGIVVVSRSPNWSRQALSAESSTNLEGVKFLLMDGWEQCSYATINSPRSLKSLYLLDHHVVNSHFSHIGQYTLYFYGVIYYYNLNTMLWCTTSPISLCSFKNFKSTHFIRKLENAMN